MRARLTNCLVKRNQSHRRNERIENPLAERSYQRVLLRILCHHFTRMHRKTMKCTRELTSREAIFQVLKAPRFHRNQRRALRDPQGVASLKGEEAVDEECLVVDMDRGGDEGEGADEGGGMGFSRALSSVLPLIRRLFGKLRVIQQIESIQLQGEALLVCRLWNLRILTLFTILGAAD